VKVGNLPYPFLRGQPLNCCFVEKHQRQLRNLLQPDSHESGGLLFGRLASLFGCAECASWKELDGNSEPVGRQKS